MSRRRLGDEKILGHGQPGEDFAALGNVPDPPAGALVCRHRGHVLAVQEHRAGAHRQLTHQAAQEGGLPHTVAAEQGGAGSRGDLQIDPAQDVASAVILVEPADVQHHRPR